MGLQKKLICEQEMLKDSSWRKRSNSFKPTLILAIFFVFITIPSCFSEINSVSFNNSHTLRISVRNNSDDYDFYATRAMVIVDWNLAPVERTVKILPFFEFQMNLDTNGWWRKEAGVEIGTNFFNDYFYYGASFQHIWQQEENYPVELFGETTEWESHFVIILPIKWGLLKDRLKLRLFDEYTYDFARGQFTFNEVGAIFDWQVFEWLRMPIGWRHVDRVSDFDADLLEFSLLFSF